MRRGDARGAGDGEDRLLGWRGAGLGHHVREAEVCCNSSMTLCSSVRKTSNGQSFAFERRRLSAIAILHQRSSVYRQPLAAKGGVSVSWGRCPFVMRRYFCTSASTSLHALGNLLPVESIASPTANTSVFTLNRLPTVPQACLLDKTAIAPCFWRSESFLSMW